MKDFKWYFNRLRAMSIPEVRWRLEQKLVERAERKTFGKQKVSVTDEIFYTGKEDLVFHGEKLPVCRMGHEDSGSNETRTGISNQDERMLSGNISLLGGYDYEIYKKDWHAGFQTDRKWPLTFSYDLDYKQRDGIGDARTNWELNRHFQFALLACNYYRTGDVKYLTELLELFSDWNEKNPFLYGISWTSVMEAAIRDINWMYALGFLMRTVRKNRENIGDKEVGAGHGMMKGETGQMIGALCGQLRKGIINMTCYISSHYSRYSSANNHVIVEAAAMGIAGIVMDCQEWLDTACSILRVEIPRQNYRDGVNKEASLHYQSFFMEAVGLFVLTMQKNGMSVSQNWRNVLVKMSRYVADCQGNYGETIVFGDDDEGKILDLQGSGYGNSSRADSVDAGNRNKEGAYKRNHYQYVLQLMSLILPERYVEGISDQTLLCIVSPEQVQNISGKPYYHNLKSICYAEGGVSVLRSRDGRALIGIDHGPLGFGTIAAHGHADALSFQMYLNGEAVFADAGTYIYHIDLESRNAFRRTESHNTAVVNGKDQSEMLGAFLWGRRAETKLLGHNLEAGNPDSDPGSGADAAAGHEDSDGPGKERFFVEAEHDGYAPVIHKRRLVFDGERCLKIWDKLTGIKGETDFQINFLFGSGCRVTEKAPGTYEIVTEKGSRIKLQIETDGIWAAVDVTDAELSQEYGMKRNAKRIRAGGRTGKDIAVVTKVKWEAWI